MVEPGKWSRDILNTRKQELVALSSELSTTFCRRKCLFNVVDFFPAEKRGGGGRWRPRRELIELIAGFTTTNLLIISTPAEAEVLNFYKH